MIYLNGKPIIPTIFPDKTSQVWNIPGLDKYGRDKIARVSWKFESEAEFMHLAQLKTLLDEYGYTSYLTLPYLPYGRQDKYVINSNTFALTTFANLLNSLQFKSVTIQDPHSSETLRLIERSVDFYPNHMVKTAFTTTNSDLVCYPDRGAVTKYESIYNFPFTYGFKERDFDGTITSYRLTQTAVVKDKNVLIVDDICDGGATFVKLAKLLYDAGATSVSLMVTHGLFTKGLEPLFNAGIKHIYTSDGEVK